MKKVTDLKLNQWTDKELVALFDCLKELLVKREYEFCFENLENLYNEIDDIHDDLGSFIDKFRDVMRPKDE